MVDEGRYLSAKTVADVWICYPWEAMYVSFRFILVSRMVVWLYGCIVAWMRDPARLADWGFFKRH